MVYPQVFQRRGLVFLRLLYRGGCVLTLNVLSFEKFGDITKQRELRKNRICSVSMQWFLAFREKFLNSLLSIYEKTRLGLAIVLAYHSIMAGHCPMAHWHNDQSKPEVDVI